MNSLKLKDISQTNMDKKNNQKGPPDAKNDAETIPFDKVAKQLLETTPKPRKKKKRKKKGKG